LPLYLTKLVNKKTALSKVTSSHKIHTVLKAQQNNSLIINEIAPSKLINSSPKIDSVLKAQPNNVLIIENINPPSTVEDDLKAEIKFLQLEVEYSNKDFEKQMKLHSKLIIDHDMQVMLKDQLIAEIENMKKDQSNNKKYIFTSDNECEQAAVGIAVYLKSKSEKSSGNVLHSYDEQQQVNIDLTFCL
jgi:hypothetical protein